MKKLFLSTVAIAAISIGASSTASAALANNAVLSFDTGVTGGYYGYIVSGSYFGLDSNGNDNIDAFERLSISQHNGLILGTVQNASGLHTGLPDGSESADIDAPWTFSGNVGMHQTTSATTLLSASGNTATIDMSGWSVAWNTIANIPMGAGADGGVGTITCAVDCGDGDTYTMTYLATVPLNDPSGFGGVGYQLHLEGTISAVPVPAAAWLFGSGLLGLVGVMRRRC